jgi:YHYH protein
MELKPSPILRLLVIHGSLLLSPKQLLADPQLSSWFTEASTKYARIYTSAANRTAGISVTTWSNQTLPTYAGVHEINYSSNWVYIKNTGLAPYIMGPWNNPNLPKNQGTSTGVYRFSRNPTVISNLATTGRTLTGQGSIGFLVDGVAIYNTSDGFSYSVSNAKDASPTAGIGAGDGIWNRDALPNEGGSFDYALNHPQPSGQYHAHANPIGVRYVLGDNINYDPTTKFYSENTSATNWKHSPIIGWVNDGLPLYGPYGYSNPTNPSSPVRRMISGYVLRDGNYGTTNLNTAGRKSLPLWAQQAQNKTTLSPGQWGPNVTTTYELGHYAEDYDYLGDLNRTQGVDFDLNKYNARYCVTPEYPNGTWAYFVTLKADGSPWYPYNVGRWYMATPPASTGFPPTPGNNTTLSVMNADTPLANYYKGATNTVETWRSNNPLTVSTNKVTLVWNAVEGGTYQIKATNDLSSTNTNWPSLATTLTATGNVATYEETGSFSSVPRRFYKLLRTGMANYDSVGY